MILPAADIARATGGRLLREGAAGPISTDSRRLAPGSWFLALRGERFDGHDYLPHAQAAGCAGAIGEHMPDGWIGGFVEVDDTLAALQDIARAVREGFDGPVVAITGSAGKTTTRAMAAEVLSALGRVHQTAGNLNNHVGLPLTILAAPVDAAVWVLELGMSGFGEIDLLQEISRPTVRLITNVGAAHLEGVGSIEGVARAKGELFAGARPGDVCCVNVDDPRVSALSIPDGVRVLRYGSAIDPTRYESEMRCDVLLTDAAIDPATLVTRYRIETSGGTVRGQIGSPGLHLALDAAAAVAIGVALRVPADQMASRLAAYAPVGMRLRLEHGPGGIRVINDAYNANPASTRGALDTLGAVVGARRVALLGDMLELGQAEAAAHEECLAHALDLDLELVGVAGPRYAAAAAALQAEDVVCAPDAASLAAAVAARLAPGDVVLLKGSRGMAMERVLQSLPAEATEETG